MSFRCVVGAQGFEPWTCSTQNCRATRLRYTPGAVSIHAYGGASKAVGGLPPPEQRVADLVARCDPVFFCRPGDHFEHTLGRSTRRNDLQRLRLGIFCDPQDSPVGTDE